MSRTITLSGKSSVLTANYFPPIELKTDYVCGLIDFHTYHSIPNINNTNNLFHIRDYIIELPVGSYEINDIITYIINRYEELKHEDKTIDENALMIKANNNTMKVEIFSETDTIHFEKERSIGPLLGFKKMQLIPGVNHLSTQTLMITQDNVVRIECNIVSGSYLNNALAHTLHEFAINVAPGYKIDEVPHNVIYLPITTKEISSLTVRLTNQEGELLNFRGEIITLRIHLKPEE